MGKPDPFKLRKEMSRKAFIYWKVRHRLKLTEFHDKTEYYLASIRNDIRSMWDGEPRPVEEGLIKFKAKTIEEMEIEQEKNDIDFMDAVIRGADMLKKRKKKKKATNGAR